MSLEMSINRINIFNKKTHESPFRKCSEANAADKSPSRTHFHAVLKKKQVCLLPDKSSESAIHFKTVRQCVRVGPCARDFAACALPKRLHPRKWHLRLGCECIKICLDKSQLTNEKTKFVFESRKCRYGCRSIKRQICRSHNVFSQRGRIINTRKKTLLKGERLGQHIPRLLIGLYLLVYSKPIQWFGIKSMGFCSKGCEWAGNAVPNSCTVCTSARNSPDGLRLDEKCCTHNPPVPNKRQETKE